MFHLRKQLAYFIERLFFILITFTASLCCALCECPAWRVSCAGWWRCEWQYDMVWWRHQRHRRCGAHYISFLELVAGRIGVCALLILYIWTMVRTDGEHDMKLMAMKRVKLLYFMFVWTEHCVITVWLTQIHSLSLVLRRLMLLLLQYRTFQHICEQRMMKEKTMVNDFLNGGFIFSKIS